MIGIDRIHGEINIDFNPEQQRIEEWFVFNRNGHAENIQYQEGDRILLSVTYKPTLMQIRDLVDSSGWTEEMTLVDEGYALMLALV